MSRSVRRLVVPLTLALLALAPAAASADVRGSVPLDKGWEFADQAEGPWEPTQVPHVMDPRPTPEVWDGRVAWSGLRFVGPETRGGRAWWLRFDQVRRRAEAFLNGRPIGANEDPYTPFSLPATGIVPGEEN